MKIIYTEKNECFRTDTVILPISQVCNGTVSLSTNQLKMATVENNKGFIIPIFCIPYEYLKWVKTVWDLGILQQHLFVCVYLDD